MARLGTRLLILTIGGTDYTAQVSKAVISSAAADSDFTTFSDAAAGGARTYSLDLVVEQNLDASTALWDKVWSAAGSSVAYLLKPYGNATASTTQPHYSGNVIIKEPDGDMIGGEANGSTSAAFTIEVSWPCTAKPTKVTS